MQIYKAQLRQQTATEALVKYCTTFFILLYIIQTVWWQLLNKNVLRCLLNDVQNRITWLLQADYSKSQVRRLRMNVLRKSVVSCGTDSIAVMQLSRSDEMGRVERGVPSSRPGHQSCSLYASTPLSCRRYALAQWKEDSEFVEVVVWRRLDRWRSGLHELHCLILCSL